jgi:ABC-2 type transport system permease protein
MKLRIARKETTEMLRDGRFRWASAAVLGLLLVALATGWQHHRSVAAEHAAAHQQTRDHWLEQGEKNPHSAAHYGMYAFTPTPPLSLVDRGIAPYVGVATWIEAHWQNPFQGRPAQDATALARFGEVTAAGVMQLLVPLLIVLLGFAAFSGERESGTFRQLLSLGVRPRDLAWGKALGQAGAFAVLLVPAAAVGAVALALASSGHAMAADAARIGLLAAVYLAYFLVFLGVTLAVSAWAPSSRVALVALLAFWIANVLVAPRASADLARRVQPAPSQWEFMAQVRQEMEQGVDGHDPADQRLDRLRERVLAEYGVATVEELPVNFSGIALQASEEHGNLVFDRNFGALHATFARQESVHTWAGLLAPMLAVRSLSMGLAGTDGAHHRHFTEQAEGYRRMVQRMMNDAITFNSRTGERYVAGPELWAQVPEFEYRAPGVRWVLGTHAGSLGVLGFWLGAAMLLVGGAARARRVDA